jgi:cell division protein FtsI (penicillin-binding protein 3)
VVAGKTGTARVYLEDIGGYETKEGKRKYQATFVGFFPAEQPLYTAIVCVYTKLRGTSIGGGSLPAMTFKEIVDDIWALDTNWGKRLGKRADVPDMRAQYIGTRKGGAPLPDVTGMGLKDAIYALENNGYRCQYEGIGHVVRQSHKPGQKYSKGEIIRLVLE